MNKVRFIPNTIVSSGLYEVINTDLTKTCQVKVITVAREIPYLHLCGYKLTGLTGGDIPSSLNNTDTYNFVQAIIVK